MKPIESTELRATATTLVCKCFAMATASDGNTMPLLLREHLIDAIVVKLHTLTSERDEARERCGTLSEEVRAWREWHYKNDSHDMEPFTTRLDSARAKTDTTSALTPPEGTQP